MDLKPSNVTADTMERIRTETIKDPVLSILNSVTMTGWPGERKSVPEEIRGFWSYRAEITADNGVLFKLDYSYSTFLTESGDASQDTQSPSRLWQQHKESAGMPLLAWNAVRHPRNLLVVWNLQPVLRRAANRAHALTQDTLTSLVKDKC